MDTTENQAVASIPPKRSFPKRGKRLSQDQRIAIKARALIDPELSHSDIARANGVHPSTVMRIVEDAKLSVLAAAELEAAKRGLASKALITSLRAQNAITDEKLENSSAVQLAVVSKINTEIVENALKSMESTTTARSLVSQFLDYQKDLESRLSYLDS